MLEGKTWYDKYVDTANVFIMLGIRQEDTLYTNNFDYSNELTVVSWTEMFEKATGLSTGHSKRKAISFLSVITGQF